MEEIEVILGNSNKNFSGVTSTMLQVMPHIDVSYAVLGKHHMDESVRVISFKEMIKLCKKPLASGSTRVFHARRNDEMIQALIAKRIYKADIKIIFTSTAQRHHSGFTKWLMSQMDAIITTCDAANAYLEKSADVIIPHGVDIERYQAPEDHSEAWKSLGFPGEYGIGVFGRVRASKGIDVVVAAAIAVLLDDPAPTLIICGETQNKDQEFQAELERKIKAAGLEERILFIGKRPFSELPSLFAGMSLVMSMSRNEGYGLTVLEAMASGAAVLASDAGAWREIITDGEHGYVVPVGDEQATRENLGKLLTRRNELVSMGERGRMHVEKHYTCKAEAKALGEYYRSIAKRGSV